MHVVVGSSPAGKRSGRAQAALSPSFTPVRGGLLQRKCACGGRPGLDDVCEQCRKKPLLAGRPVMAHGASTIVPASMNGAPEQYAGHCFGRVCVHSDAATGNGFISPLNTNGSSDEVSFGEEPDSGESGPVLPGQFFPAPAERMPGPFEDLTPDVEPLDEGGAKTKCPAKTVVEKTVDMTPDGIKKGYRTGYGAVAVMAVQPDATNWDGTPVVESLKLTKNSCPKEFGISPCSGNSTFTVGAETNSSVLGKLEATKNRFYDFHITRWNKGSLLHDRNPDNVDSCQAECEQTYSCGGNAIGKHTVTRSFTKGKSGSRDVTLVAVTKK